VRIQNYGTVVLAVKDFLLYYPSETVSWLMLGQARQGEGNINAALDAYSQAIVSDKKSPDAQLVLLARGQLYLQQRQFQKAFDDFDQAILISDTREGLRGRYEAALGLQDYKTAETDAAALLALTPNDAPLQLAYVDLLIRNQQFTDAAPILTDKFVNSLSKDDKPTGWLFRGIVKFATAKTSEKSQGLDDINNALAVRESGLGHYYRGQIYEALSRPEDAIADYQWLLYWNSLYHYSYIDDVSARLDTLGSSLPSPTPSITPRPTLTETPTKVVTPTRTPRGTPAASATPTDTETPEETPTETPTETETPTPTETPTAAATAS